MRKVILTCGLIAMLFAASAQEKGTNNKRERLKSLLEMKEGKDLTSSLKSLEKSKDEEERMLAYAYYSRKDQDEKANTLRQHIIAAFPHGRFALEQKAREISQLASLEEKDAKFQALLKEYPDAPVAFEMYNMAVAYADKGNVDKMKEYALLYKNYARDRNGNAFDDRKVFAGLADFLARLNPKAAIPLLADGLDYERSALAKPEEGETEEIRAQRRARGETTYYHMLASYASALLQTERKAEGLQLTAAMRQELNGKKIGQMFNTVYIDALLANERYADAFPFLEEGYRKNNLLQTNAELLKKGYTAIHGSADGFPAYMDTLEFARKEFAQQQLLKKVISKEAPHFELKDVDGNTVRLADLKGKVVVLDFWATWCGPCKASFPMMQKAVNKYKADPNVKFLFIHTWEKGNGDPVVNAKKYITDNHYTFDVLMDLRDAGTRVSGVAKAYEVEGIPAKFIIDAHGRIRFDSGAAGIDEEKALEELSAMIDFAKKG